ncbi:hypothetical protein CDD83_6391 [Cordyceps sp. RAO-2017]|nr:hypothetical protein CDD83_6391 [Cordyceps sp. RAO-2017]
MAADIGHISQLLNATLDPSQHRKAESALKQEATKPQYSLSLLNIVNSDSLPPNTRLASALAFKNFIRYNYVDEEGNYKLPQDEVQTIKERLIGLMISSPSNVQSQLGEAISVIADSDFWRRWETLTQDLVNKFSSTDPKVNIGVLEVAHSIFARWRPLMRTDELYTEINHVISTFGQPFVQLLVTTDGKITGNASNQEVLKGWFEVLDLQIKILHDMASHDLPPIFEENLGSISELLHKYFVYSNPLLDTDDDTEVSIVDTVKADVCELLELFTIKYDEDFSKYCDPFISSAWNLLSTTGLEIKYDNIVSKALHFLTAVAATAQHSEKFNDENVLTQIVEKVVLPNVALRESDLEMFEDEPIEFIRRDLEGSDNDSRRRSATDFLRKLLEKFEARVTHIVSSYASHYLSQGKTDWKAKDTGVYLFMSVAAKGAVTAAQGVKTVNPLLDVVSFFEQNIASDLVGGDQTEPISTVDAIKYLYTFRSQLSKDQWKMALGPLVQNLNSPNYVVYSYAAIAVERVLFLADDAGNQMFPRADIEPFAKDLLTHLFKLIEKETSPEKLQENEFLMRCVMRILIVIKDGAAPMLDNVLTHLILITNVMKQNPSNPRFYYYHFEAMGALVRYCAATSADLFNQKLWEPFHKILAEDVTEFVPYIFQILAQLLESSPSNAVSDNFKALLEPLLAAPLWETRGNVPACTRLLSAVIPKASKILVAENQLEPVLGIFQKLLSGKKSELHAFDILDAIVYSFEPTTMDKYFGTIIQLLYTKLQGSPSDSLKLRFARFYHLVGAQLEAGYGADYFIKQSNQVDERAFAQVYPPFVLAETEKLAKPVDRKTAVVSLTKTLCDSQVFAQKFMKGWANSCRILLSLLANPPAVSAGLDSEIITEASVDDIGFGLTFTPLNTCRPVARDDFPDVVDVTKWVKQYMVAANQRHGGAVEGFITQRLNELPPAARAVLAWGALLGSSFSFELIARLMEGEFEFEDEITNCCPEDIPRRSYSEGEAIAGLQAAIQAYIIVPSETDDRFRFAHDRYVNASSALKECNARRMHFIISQTLLKYYAAEARQRDSTASHICEAVCIIKRRVPARCEFRKLLMECAQAAAENGARPTAAKYYSAAIDLLQDAPWVDEAEDVSYEETMQLHLRSAECFLFMGQLPAANDLLSTIFANARTPVDKAPAYVLQSRIFAQNGNSLAAFISLKECLAALGVPLDDEPSYDKCDEWFERLATQIQLMERSALLKPKKSSEAIIASIGAVLSETASAAWWSDCLHFYHLTLVMLEVHLSRGAFPQSGMAFLNLGVVALSRFNMTQFAVELGSICQELLYQPGDAFSMARGQMLHACCIGHVQYTMSVSVTQMEDAIEMASVGGDRMSTILSYGLCAQAKFFASENYADLEGFCHYGCEDIPNWSFDTRGGALLVAIRQTCRALQGKTHVHDAVGVLSDEQHDGLVYKSWLTSQTQESNRSSLFYESLELVALYLFGHYDRAVEIGRKSCELLSMLWSARNSRLILLFYGLSRAGQLLRQMQDPRHQAVDFSAEKTEVVADLRRFVKMMVDWSAVSDVNYRSWSRLLEAQIAELSEDHGQAIRHYEEALDHAAEQDFVFEEALGNYLLAGFFIRRKARRSARAALQDAVGLYRQMAATGVAKAIENEHSLLLHGPTRNYRTAEVGIQTDFVADAPSVQYRTVDGEDGDDLRQFPTGTAISDLRGDRIGAWRGSMNMQTGDGAGLPALDMIDLHAILVSSQVISSVLQVDELLKTMCDVVLQTCGGSASRAAIVVQETDAESWCVAASGNPERGASAHKPGLSLSGTSLVAENVVLYCTRFLEPVFIPDLLADERFGNVNEAWLQRHPLGKAIIAIPICHGMKPLLGVLYLEGEPGSFTDRNVTVLQLLVNQIGISYSNALSMKNVEKISAENRSMVSVQKRALAKALEAETKAKNAEAEAKRNVKLAEEAAKAKSIFLANVSHELRTPLNGVIGNSELLRDSQLNKEQLEMADSIRVSADLLLTVINDILDFSKMEADKMKLYIIAFNPEEMVREVVRAVSYSNREKTSKKNVRIVQDINLPPMLIYGDPIRLHQVLGNLIGNSLKFTEDGSITIGARLDSETDEKATLTFWVRDTGIGIPPQQLAKLFQPFSQADASTARKYGGSGLGLSICKSLIEIMMKGKIQLESEETVGTTAWFTVAFDKAKPDVAAGDAQSKSSPPIDRYSATTSVSERAASPNPFLDLTQMRKEDVRICVAEDNPINQKIAIQYVQRLGYPSVSAYENGLKAVEGLRQRAREGKPYHIVLMDVQMPVLDGYEATKLLRKDSIEAVRKVLVIAMTASAIQGDREKCLAAGMNDYLAKPVRSEVLKKKLDAYVSNVRCNLPESACAPPSPLTIDGPPGEAEADASPPNDRGPAGSEKTLSITVSGSVSEGAIYDVPLNSPGFLGTNGPLRGVEHDEESVSVSIPIREGHARRRSPSPSSSQAPRQASNGTGAATAPSSEKRQPHRLTKSWGNGDSEGARVHKRPND